MSTRQHNEIGNMDRRAFLKTSLLASGALLIGIGSCAREESGEMAKPGYRTCTSASILMEKSPSSAKTPMPDRA
jgi:hypothetical protein